MVAMRVSRRLYVKLASCLFRDKVRKLLPRPAMSFQILTPIQSSDDLTSAFQTSIHPIPLFQWHPLIKMVSLCLSEGERRESPSGPKELFFNQTDIKHVLLNLLTK